MPPGNRRTFGNWLRELAEFTIAPLTPGFDLERYDRELSRPLPSEPQLAPRLQILAESARHLAVTFGCKVTGVDLSPSCIDAANYLTARCESMTDAAIGEA